MLFLFSKIPTFSFKLLHSTHLSSQSLSVGIYCINLSSLRNTVKHQIYLGSAYKGKKDEKWGHVTYVLKTLQFKNSEVLLLCNILKETNNYCGSHLQLSSFKFATGFSFSLSFCGPLMILEFPLNVLGSKTQF